MRDGDRESCWSPLSLVQMEVEFSEGLLLVLEVVFGARASLPPSALPLPLAVPRLDLTFVPAVLTKLQQLRSLLEGRPRGEGEEEEEEEEGEELEEEGEEEEEEEEEEKGEGVAEFAMVSCHTGLSLLVDELVAMFEGLQTTLLALEREVALLRRDQEGGWAPLCSCTHTHSVSSEGDAPVCLGHKLNNFSLSPPLPLPPSLPPSPPLSPLIYCSGSPRVSGQQFGCRPLRQS